jgi:carboxymethylenebutenolidase
MAVVQSPRTYTADTNGLDAGEVKIPTAEGVEMPGYRAMPLKGKTFPVVLVVEEMFGVHERIKDLCRRLAISPELFVRQGDVSKIENIQEIITELVSKVADSQGMSDLDSTVTPSVWPSPDSAGAAAWSGSTRRTARS